MRVRADAALWLLPLLLFAPLAFLSLDTLFGNTDALFYTTLMKLCGQQFLAGNLWPRWLMELDAGIGGPVMYYYPHLPYTLTALLTWPLAAAGVPEGFCMLAGMYLAIVASGYTARRWLSRHFPAHVALMGALLYALLPYRLIYIYLHFNLAQLWALAVLPLWMMAAEALAAERRRSWALFALSGALTGYMHPLTLLAFGAVPVAYVCWLGRARWKRVLPPLLLALLLTAMLMASYAASVTAAKSWIAAGNFTNGKFNVFANLWHADSILQVLYLFIGFLALKVARLAPGAPHATRFFAALLLVLWLMTLGISAPLWHLLAPLQVLQFPSARLNSGMLVAASFLACAYLADIGGLKNPPEYLRQPMLWMLVGVFSLSALVHTYMIYREAKDLTPDYVRTMQQRNIVYEAWYRMPWGSRMDGAAIYKDADHLSTLPQVVFLAGQGTVDVNWWKPGDIGFTAHVKSVHAVLAVRQRYVPAWKALPQFDRDLPYPATIVPVEREALVGVTLQQGDNPVRLSLRSSSAQRVCDALSIATLLTLLVVLMNIRLNRRHDRTAA